MSLIEPEQIVEHIDRYADGYWDYQKRCADVELAMTVTRERIEEWDQDQDPHGWWHERPHLIALHNEIIRLHELMEP